MNPIEFKQQNCKIAEHQPEYMTLHGHRTKDGEVLSCWALSAEEVEKINETGVIWFRQWTLNKPMQPVLLQTEHPWDDEQMGERFGTHYDMINEDESHSENSCTDPERCDCICRHCMDVWYKAGKPGTLKVGERCPECGHPASADGPNGNCPTCEYIHKGTTDLIQSEMDADSEGKGPS